MLSSRFWFVVALCCMVQACAAVDKNPTGSLTACGPEVSRNSVRIIDARDEFDSGGVEAAIERAQASVGSIQMLDLDLHRSVHFVALKGIAARRGCDVVIHVQKVKNVENSGWDGHFVLLARRESGVGE